MRNKGDKNEFKDMQDAEIMKAYRRIFSIYGGAVDVRTLYQMVSFAPASRFFVSSRQAYRVISRMMNGEQISSMRAVNQRMYREIHRRVLEKLAQYHDYSQTLLRKAVAEVVRQPAPEMYIGVRQVSFIISREKKKCYEEKRQRLRHCL